MANWLEPGQVVKVNGKDATVITVGDGIVHLEQDGEAISVHPDDIQTGDAPSQQPAPGEIPAASTSSALGTDEGAPYNPQLIAELISLRQRVTALEDKAEGIGKVLAALTAGPQDKPKSESSAPATSAAAPAESGTEASAPTADAAASAGE